MYGDPNSPRAVTTVGLDCGEGATCCTIQDTFAYDANGNMEVRNGGVIEWSSFNKPTRINESPGRDQATNNWLPADNCNFDCSELEYGPQRELLKQAFKSGANQRNVTYVGEGFEVESGASGAEYRVQGVINGVPVVSFVKNNYAGGSGAAAYTILRDHLGSVDTMVVAIGGSEDLAFSFDSFGKRRNPNWTPDNSNALPEPTVHNHRGYTGHEQLDSVGLIHMKGRVYDPMLGRMLSPDPVMGYLEAPQQLDPYGYVTNNPLRYTDPSGYFLGGFFRRLFSTENVIGNGLGRIHPFVAFMYEYKEFMDARMAGGTRSNWYHMAGNSLQGIDRTFGTGYHEQGSLAMSGNSMAGVGPSIEQVVDQAYNEWRYIAEPSAAQMEAIYNTTLHELVRQGFDVSAIGYVDKYAVRYGENSGKNFTGYKLFDSKSEAQDFINQDPENRSMPGAFAVASAGRIVVFRGAFLQVPTATMDQWDGLNQRGVWSDIDYDDPVEAMLFQMGHEFGHLEQGDGRSSIKREQKANRRGRETVESYRGHKN